MSTYSLTLKINAADLPMLRASGLNITLARPVSGASSPNVTWLVFAPLEENTVEWQEDYGLCASATQQLVNGATLSRMSELVQAQPSTYYSFAASGTFAGPFSGPGAPGAGQYRVNNDMPRNLFPAITFGVQQAAKSSSAGDIPATLITAQTVPAGFSVTFTPMVTVYVWLQANIASGTVINSVANTATIVSFGGATVSQTLVYDPTTGLFVPQSTSGNMLALGVVPHAEVPHVGLYKPQGIY